MSTNVVWRRHPFDRTTRAEIKSQSPLLIRFTGIDSPYEKPAADELQINTNSMTVDESVNRLLDYLDKAGTLKAVYQPILQRA